MGEAKSNKRRLPDLLFVKPIGGGRVKVEHLHVVAEVTKFDEQGRPRELRLLRDDDVVDVDPAHNGGKEKAFVTLYVQKRSLSTWQVFLDGKVG